MNTYRYVYDIRERERLSHCLAVPAIAGRAHVSTVEAAALVIGQCCAFSRRQRGILEELVRAHLLARLP